MRALLLTLLLLTVTLAGCSDSGGGGDEAEDENELDPNAIVSEDGRDLRTELTAEDSVAAPQWEVGDWFGHHVFGINGESAATDTTGTHINTIVVEDEGSSWYLATDSPDIALFEALFGTPIIGSVDKQSLSTPAFGGAWEVYQFPMSDGMTYTGELTWDLGLTWIVDYTVTFDGAIDTPYGARPGYVIEGYVAGNLTVVTDYVPDIGWYSSFDLFHPFTGELAVRVISMGFGAGYVGPYFIDEATQLISQDFSFGLTPDGEVTVEAAGLIDFTVSPDMSFLAGYFYCYGITGAELMRILDPQNQVAFECDIVDTSVLEGAGNGEFIVEESPEAGLWHFGQIGAGAATGAGAHLWEVLQVEYRMDGDGPDTEIDETL